MAKKNQKRIVSNPHEQIIFNHSFTSPQGANCRVVNFIPNSDICEVLNNDTGELIKIDFNKVERFLPDWNPNTQMVKNK